MQKDKKVKFYSFINSHSLTSPLPLKLPFLKTYLGSLAPGRSQCKCPLEYGLELNSASQRFQSHGVARMARLPALSLQRGLHSPSLQRKTEYTVLEQFEGWKYVVGFLSVVVVG